MIKLNIGGGKGHPKVPGWTIVDNREGADLKVDISRDRLPYADNSVDAIFTSHTLDLIAPSRLPWVLDEFRRVIKPGGMNEISGGDWTFSGGIVRISVPDIALACRAYAENNRAFFDNSNFSTRDPEGPIGGMLAAWFYSIAGVTHGHVHCFDEKYLSWWLKKHRFDQCYRSAYRKSLLPELRAEGFDLHQHDSLFVEAWKTDGRKAA